MVSSAIQADEKEIEVLFTSKTLTPEAALIVSQAALESCRKAGLQVSSCKSRPPRRHPGILPAQRKKNPPSFTDPQLHGILR